jgi:hypothetical protein
VPRCDRSARDRPGRSRRGFLRGFAAVRASSDPPRCEPRNIHVADPARSLTDRAGFVRRIDLAKVLRPSTQDRYATSWLRRLECPARDLGHEHMTRFCFSSKCLSENILNPMNRL